MDLPDAIPPVRATFSISWSGSIFDFWIADCRLKTYGPSLPSTSGNRQSKTSSSAGQLGDPVAAPHLCRFQSIEHQHGDGERTDSAGNRRQGSGNFGDVGMHVADESRSFLAEGFFPPGIAGKELLELGRICDGIHADVNYRGAGRHEVTGDDAGAPDRGQQNGGAAASARQVMSARVANGDRCIRVCQKHGRRLADDIASAHHYSFAAGDRDVTALQDFDHASRGTGNKSVFEWTENRRSWDGSRPHPWRGRPPEALAWNRREQAAAVERGCRRSRHAGSGPR